MKYRLLTILIALLATVSTTVSAQSDEVRIIVFGAHPDDCDLCAGGTALLWNKEVGYKVKFVTLTNGNKGHHAMTPADLAERRKKEYQEAGRRFGVEYIDLGNNDGELMPTLENRIKVIREIRNWNADIVITHRPNDYHPDHRYTGQLVMDAAYMIGVPLMDKESEPLRKNPVFLYTKDRFTRPNRFSPDIVIDISSVFDQKMYGVDAHVSQFYEWLPWIANYETDVPSDPSKRLEWLKSFRGFRDYPTDEMKQRLVEVYGKERADAVKAVEAFEICEYSKHPDAAELKRLFPFYKKSQ